MGHPLTRPSHPPPVRRAAPEILMGGSRCTSAVDIYSFGICLWEIVTGEHPQRGNMRAPRVPEECSQEVADLIQRCMAFDPTQRPTALVVMQELGVLSRSVRNSLSIEHSTSSPTSSSATPEQAAGPLQVSRPESLSQGGSSQDNSCVDYVI